MAYKPSKYQKKRYNKLLRNIRSVRKVLKYGQQLGNRSMVTEENEGRVLPDLVIHTEVRNQSLFTSKEAFNKIVETILK